jgi:hypothetical protein
VNSLATTFTSTTQRSALTAVALIAVLAAAGWFLLVGPKRSDASHLKSQIATANTKLVTATHAAAAASHRAEVAALLALPSAPDQPGILDQLNALGKSTNVVVAGVTPNLTTVTANGVDLTVIVNGKYFQIRDFLRKLRTQVSVGHAGTVRATGRLFNVNSVSIATASTTTVGQLSATLDVTAAVLGSATAAPAATAPGTSTTATGAASGGSN